mmetsp:Transcript_27263/g.62942  ORF Transcript_27263/g.62942 Transcript_27263/m.62942 type:complete len:1242 (+) Transcript_27263:167-3892(+)
MDGMDRLGTDFHATGSVMTPAQLKEYRLKRGECVTCGRKCFQKKLFKMTPITEHGKVLKGRCLNCNPLDASSASGDNAGIPAVSRKATKEDLQRFNKSQLNLMRGPPAPPAGRSAPRRTASQEQNLPGGGPIRRSQSSDGLGLTTVRRGGRRPAPTSNTKSSGAPPPPRLRPAVSMEHPSSSGEFSAPQSRGTKSAEFYAPESPRQPPPPVRGGRSGKPHRTTAAATAVPPPPPKLTESPNKPQSSKHPPALESPRQQQRRGPTQRTRSMEDIPKLRSALGQQQQQQHNNNNNMEQPGRRSFTAVTSSEQPVRRSLTAVTSSEQQQQQQQRRTWATIVYCLICFGIVRIAHTLLQSPSDESMTPTPMAETASSTEEMSAHADPKVDHGANRSLEEGENSQPTKNNPGDSNSSLRMIDSVSDVLVAMEITNSQPMANNPDNSNSSLGMIDSVEDAHSQPTPNNSDESSSSLEQINSVVEAMGRENSQPTANSSGDSNPSIGKIGSLPDANEGDSASITNVVRTDNGSNFEEGVNPSLVDSIVHDKSPVKEDTNLPQHDPLTSTSETAFVNTAEMQAPAATSSSELMQGKESSEQATEFDSASVGFLLVVVVAFLYQLFVGKRPSKSDSPLDLQQKSSDSVEGGGNQQSIQKEDKQIFVLTVVVPDVIRRPSNEVRDEWRPFVADTGDEGDSSRTVAVNLHFLAVNTMNGFIRRSKLSRSSVYMAADSRSNSTSIQVVSVSSEKMQELVDEFSILGIGCSVGMMYASRAHSMYTRTTKANEGDDDASLLPTLSHASALWQHGENLVEPRSLDNEDLSVSTSDSFRYKSSVASVGSNRGDVAYVGSLGEQREEATPKHGNSSKHSRIPSVDGGKSEEIGPEHEIVFAPSHADSDDDVPGPLFTVQLGETDGKTTQHSDDTPPAPSNAVASPPWTLVKKKRKHHGRKAATLLTLFLPTSGAFRWNALPSVSFVNSSKGAIRYNGLNSRSQSGVKMVSSEKSDPIVSGQKIGVRAKAVVIGVMGGIGAGKSTACRMLSEVIPVGSATVHLEADIIARDLYKPGSELVEALAKEFGTTVIAEDGQINRPALADIIFKDNEARHRLEQIVWPLTKQEILRQIDAFANEWNANKGNDTFFVAVLEAAMLLDAGWEDMLDELWVVTASADIAFQRLVGGERGLDPDDARRRMTDQESRRGIGNLNEEVERGFVTAVVDNSGTTADLRRSLDNTLKDVVDKWQKSRGIETN